MKIKFIGYGIASRIGNTIYIHKKIRKRYPTLYKAILKHEQEHTSGFTFKDVLIDLQGKHLREVKKDYWKFVITTPNSWIQFLPVGIYNRIVVFDIGMIVLWIILVLFALIILMMPR